MGFLAGEATQGELQGEYDHFYGAISNFRQFVMFTGYRGFSDKFRLNFYLLVLM